MAVELVMPRMSDTMESGTIARWLKQEGQDVKKGEPIAEIETDKATMQLESYAGGTLQRILLKEGQSAPIGTPIAVIGEAGEAPAAKAAPSAQPPPSVTTAAPVPPTPTPTPSQGRIIASPIARRLAEELNIDLRGVTGTGPGGRITREDVELVAEQQRGLPAAAPAAPVAPAPTAPVEPAAAPVERPLTRMQETIARRMVLSKTTIPHFYVTAEVDMAEAAQLRQQLIEAWTEVRVSFRDLIVTAVGLALKAHPIVNASWRENAIEYHGDVNVGYAVATEGGLLVPVLHQVDKTGLRTLSKQLKDLVQRTREGKSMPGDFEGGTFTVSNLGQYPVEDFLAIVNPPESAILAVARIEKKPVVKGDAIVISERVHLSLSADHRVFYGATAGEFLGTLKSLLENPLSLVG